jgi:hypothetical protein
LFVELDIRERRTIALLKLSCSNSQIRSSIEENNEKKRSSKQLFFRRNNIARKVNHVGIIRIDGLGHGKSRFKQFPALVFALHDAKLSDNSVFSGAHVSRQIRVVSSSVLVVHQHHHILHKHEKKNDLGFFSTLEMTSLGSYPKRWEAALLNACTMPLGEITIFWGEKNERKEETR